MYNSFKRQEWAFIFIIFTIFIISSISAISYLTSENVFDAKITYVNNDKLPYSIIVEVEKKINDDLDLEFEIIYPKENLVIGSEEITCSLDVCEIKIYLKKAFFDTLSLSIITKEEKKFYKKELFFELEQLEKNNKLIVNPNVILSNYIEPVISGKLLLEYPSAVIFKVFPQNNPSNFIDLKMNCTIDCSFDINLSNDIEFGRYLIQAYLPDDTLSSNFNVQLEGIVPKKIKKNTTSKKSPYLSLINTTDEIAYTDFQGRNKIALSEDYDSLNFNEIATLHKENKNDLVKVSLSSLSEKKYLSKLSSKNDLTQNSFQPTFKEETVGFADLVPQTLSFQTLLEEEKNIVYEDENLYFDNAQKLIDLDGGETLPERKLIPGFYTYEKVTRYDDGSQLIEEESFAYGLITINSKKPLYKKGEVIEFLIVVLDKWGYLVDDADILLEITKPSGDTIILNSLSGQISKTSKVGVYQVSLLADELGEYLLYSEVEISDVIVDVSSFVNVAESYPFDIIRDVPATIDPWEGPFENSFEISEVDLSYDGVFTLTEVFSSDFEINETNAHQILVENETTYLIWNNIDTTFDPYYIAQVPLVTPYLYYLGNAWIDFGDERFYENRSWLFAIDPAAKFCSFESPCICGSGCSGGGEPGDGTIDACGDGDTTYEFVNDIRVTSLNGSYFGVGDTVEICVDFQTDSSNSGDRVTMGYKNGGSGWVNGDVIYDAQEDNNNLNTICVDQVLDNYVGEHHVRGKLVWQFSARPANDICDEPTYYDHDDLEFFVLDKLAPTQISWNLDNGTTTGNNLDVIRGNTINSTVVWDLPLQSGFAIHNSTGSFVSYAVDSFENNQTIYTLDTSDLVTYPSIGPIQISTMQANDLYFDITGNSSGTRDFTVFAEVELNQSSLLPNVGYQGLNSTMSCQFIDANINTETYSNIDVNFYKNGSFLGSNLTDITGFASYSFQENSLGTFNISCIAQTNVSKYFIATSFAQDSKDLIVRVNNSDITIPIISDISADPSLFSIGGVTTITANVTDDINLDSVFVVITFPNTTTTSFPMVNVGGDIFNYTFTQTAQDGDYKYYILALDNSSNPAFSSTKNLEVVGVRAFIGIQSQQNLFKLGQSLNLTSFTKTEDITNTIYSEVGDVNFISYSFDSSDEGWTSSGTQDEWERGVPSDADLNTCDSSNCWVTDLNANYNNNANNVIESPVIDMTDRFNPVVNFWREIKLVAGISDRIFFESFDGVSWNLLYQNTIGAHDQEGAFYTYYPSEIEDISNSQFRFRMTSTGSGVDEGFAFDSFNLSFDPREDWDKDWNYINSTFGTDVTKITAIKFGINVTIYNSTGSDLNGNPSPDIEFQIFNGTDYSTSRYCNLDNTKIYPFYCSFVIKNTPEYLNAWNESTLRNVRFRVVDIDQQDNITFTNIKREYITPSIVENNGEGQLTAYLLQQFKNSSGGIVATLNFAPISINPAEAKQLSDFWSYSISGNFQLGTYSAYVAITDVLGNVLQNEDDFSFINDSYEFTIQSLIINYLNPSESFNNTETFLTNITLNTSSYGFGGWCGYSLNGQANVTMNNPSLNYLESTVENISDGPNTMEVFCNDTDGDIVTTGMRFFNISEPPRINFITPTPTNNSVINQTWAFINTSIQDSTFNSSWLEFDSIIYPMSCSFIGGITQICNYNISIKNNNYSYRVCANDSLSNVFCTDFRNVQINATLPQLSLLSPINGSKIFLGNYLNITLGSDLPLNASWYSINLGTNMSMSFLSPTLWNSSILLGTGYYIITAYANDSLNNLMSTEHYFYVLPDKHIRVSKSISSLGDSQYQIKYNFTNFGEWKNHTLLELIPSTILKNSSTIVPNSTDILGFGDLEIYTFSQNKNSSFMFSSVYNISVMSSLVDLFAFGQE